MVNKIIKMIETTIETKETALKTLQHSFQVDAQAHINERSFENNAMQSLLAMKALKAEIEVLDTQLQILKLQQKTKL